MKELTNLSLRIGQSHCQKFVICGSNYIPDKKSINRLISFVPSNHTMEKQDKKNSILACAEELFSELGYEGTSTRLIAKEAGANMSMISYYFGSKEGVFLEIMNKRLITFRAELAIIDEDNIPALQKLFRIIDKYARKTLTNIRFHKMMHRELSLAQRPEIFEKLKGAMKDNLRFIEKIIEDGIADGSFRPVDKTMLVSTIMGTITKVATIPCNISGYDDIDMNIPADREILTQRLISHLEDLVQTYLTPQK